MTDFKSPELNPKLLDQITNEIKVKDRYQRLRQDLTSGALTAIASAIQNLIINQPVDKPKILSHLNDAGTILAELSHSQNKCRAVTIAQAALIEFREILKTAKPSNFLFGDNLLERVKKAKSAGQVLKFKNKSGYKSSRKFPKRNLNYQRLSGFHSFLTPTGNQGVPPPQQQQQQSYYLPTMQKRGRGGLGRPRQGPPKQPTPEK